MLFAVFATSASAEPAIAATGDALEASYLLKVRDKQGKLSERVWVLTRGDNRIATGEPDGIEEIWRRDARGNLSYEKVFHRDRRILDYAASDLRALGQTPDWASLGSMVHPDVVGTKLRFSGDRRIGSFSGKQYTGAENQTRLKLVWLPALRLPAYLKRTHAGEVTEFVLRGVRHVEAATIESRTAGYVRLDYADLDDNPSDPFFQRLAQSAHAGGHHH